MANMGVGDRWAGWAIAHTSFGRSVNTILIRGDWMHPPPTLQVAHLALDTFLYPWAQDHEGHSNFFYLSNR